MDITASRTQTALQAKPTKTEDILAWAEECVALGLFDKGLELSDQLLDSQLAGSALMIKAQIRCLQGASHHELISLLQDAAKKGHPLAKLYACITAKTPDAAVLSSLAKEMPNWDLASYCLLFTPCPEIYGTNLTAEETEALINSTKADFRQYITEKEAAAAAAAEEEAKKKELAAKIAAKKLAELEERRQEEARKAAEAKAAQESQEAKEKAKLAAIEATTAKIRKTCAWLTCICSLVCMVFLYLAWTPNHGVLTTCAAPFVLKLFYSILLILNLIVGLYFLACESKVFNYIPKSSPILTSITFLISYTIASLISLNCIYYQAETGWGAFAYCVFFYATGVLGCFITGDQCYKWYWPLLYNVATFGLTFYVYIFNIL